MIIKWIKKQFKKILIVLGIIGIAVASQFGGAPAPSFPVVEVNGQVIEFSYTDDNTGEDLIIYTDKETYGGWNEAEIYIMIENISGEKQETKIKFLSDVDEFLGEISRLGKDIPYQIAVNDYATTAYDCGYQSTTTQEWVDKICEREEIVGTHQETRYRDEWQKLEDFDNEAEFTLPKDKIAYFKTYVEFPRKAKGEFFIEVTGDKQGWGTLDPWWNSNYSNKFSIISSTTLVDITTSSIPLLIDLSNAPAGFWSAVQSDFDDIRITSSTEDGTLNFELVNASTTAQTGELWLNTGDDGISSTTPKTFYVYYGNAGASDTSTSTTWNSNYKGVWHLKDSPNATTTQDSTVNDNDGVKPIGPEDPVEVDGKIGKAQDFDGINASFDIASPVTGLPIGSADRTATMWVNIDDYGTFNWFMYYGPASGTAEAFNFYITVTNGYLSFSSISNDLGSTTAVPTLTWNHIAVTISGGDGVILYLNGSEVESGTLGQAVNTTASQIWLGTRIDEDFFYDGRMDETRLLDTVLPSNWISTEYNNVNSSSTFWAFGAQEDVPVGAVGVPLFINYYE